MNQCLKINSDLLSSGEVHLWLWLVLVAGALQSQWKQDTEEEDDKTGNTEAEVGQRCAITWFEEDLAGYECMWQWRVDQMPTLLLWSYITQHTNQRWPLLLDRDKASPTLWDARALHYQVKLVKIPVPV